MFNKNQTNGAIDQAKGKAKQTIGHATNDPALKDEGRADEVAGKVESAVGNAQRNVGNAVERAGQAIKR
jgi:uncharacterized protein YjbJ (UPF0337 family)